MRTLIAIILFVAAVARADVITSNAAGHVVAFTNDQSNFSWTPKALGIIYPAPVSAAVTISRHGGGVLTLASNSFTSATLIWVPAGEYHFPTHSSLVVSSSVPGFAVQLHRGPTP